MGKDANGTLPMRVNMAPIKIYEKKTITNKKIDKGQIQQALCRYAITCHALRKHVND